MMQRTRFCLLNQTVGYGAEPVEHFDEVEGGLEVSAQLVVSGGISAPVLTPVEAAFDLVAPLVGVRVERGWPAAVAAFTQPVGDLVSELRDRRGDVFVPQPLPVGP